MRGALIHGVLLAVMLVYGYRTWTRDTSIQPDLGSVVMWNKTDADLVAIEFKTEKMINRLERRGQGKDSYWWGLETTIEKKAKPAAKPAEGSAAGSAEGSGSADGSGSAAGSAAGSGSAAPAVAEEEIRKTREYPLGEAAETVIKNFTTAHALRDLGVPTDDQKKDYKLNDAKNVLTVTFKDGARSFLVGGPVYGGSDRYVADQKTNRAYVLSRDLVSNLEIGQSTLHLLDPHGFDSQKVEEVTIAAGDKSKTVVRVQTGVEGQQIKTWGDPKTKKADQTVANFVDNTNNLRPTEFLPDLKMNELTPVMKLTYKDALGNKLGTLTLLKHEKPGDLSPGQELDPANPPKGEIEYVILTEKTRIPAVVRRDSAQRTEGDIPTVFSSEHPTSIEPKGNPFGNAPLPPPTPHGGAGSAAGSAAGSGAGSGAAAGSAAPAAPAGGKADAAKPAAPGGKADAAKPAAPAKKGDAANAHGW